MSNKKTDIVKAGKDLTEEHKQVIDIYIADSKHNAVQALLSVRPNLAYNTAKSLVHTIIGSPKAKDYIKKRRQELRSVNSLELEEYLDRLQDITEVEPNKIALMSEDDIENLPTAIGRSLQSCEVKRRTITSRNGDVTNETTIKIAVVNKADAYDKIAKVKGFNAIDNAQRNGANNDIPTMLSQCANDDERKELLRAISMVIKASNKG